MTRVSPALIQTLSLPGSVYSTSLDRHFQVFSQDGKLYQSEWQSDPDGQDVFRNTHEIAWIIGSGANGFGGLITRGSYLFEAPLSYYTKTNEWRLSPGYESVDIAFNRSIQADCIFCHSGRPKPIEQNTGKFDAIPFSQLAIGCENCHGPGAKHIRAMHLHPDTLTNLQIVNPNHLTANLDNDICMSCHQGGDIRVPRQGKTYADFRPGTFLDETLSILAIPMERNGQRNSDHVNQYFEMSMSKCYRGSGGQLRCTTCHDPHVEPTQEEAPAYFNGTCMGCHAKHTCTLSLQTRQRTTPADNCIGCHMPRKDLNARVHDSLSNHRILAQPDEPWPDVAYQQTLPSLPDLVDLDRVPGHDDTVPALSLLEAYKDISAREPEYESSYLKTLSKLEQTDPENADVQLALGFQALRNKDVNQAIEHLRHSILLGPNTTLAYAYLSEALRQNNQIDDAIAAMEKAVSLDPYNAPLQRVLIGRLLAGMKYQEAESVAEHYIQIFPEDLRMRKVLAQIKSTR